MKKIKTRPAFKCHGGKSYLSSWIISYFPDNYEQLTYIEPFCGGASVLLNKNISQEEIINDLDENIVNLYRVIRDQIQEFVSRIKKIKYNKQTFDEALALKCNNEMDQAVNEFILRRMSRGGFKKAFAWSNRMRGGQPGEINAWKTIIDSLPQISQRLKDVYIFNKPAKDIIKVFDDENNLAEEQAEAIAKSNIFYYCDPPYLPETRESPEVYSIEMTLDDHIELAEILNNCKSKVLISGYPSRLYNRLYKNWKCEKKNIANHASQQKTKPIKTELLWRNF